jgi:hypothetical protein
MMLNCGVKYCSRAVTARPITTAAQLRIVNSGRSVPKPQSMANNYTTATCSNFYQIDSTRRYQHVRQFHSSLHHDEAAYAVPIVIDEFDPRNFGYRVVSLSTVRRSSSYSHTYEVDNGNHWSNRKPIQINSSNLHDDALEEIFKQPQPMDIAPARRTVFSSKFFNADADLS